MPSSPIRAVRWLALCLPALAACTVGPDFKRPSPDVPAAWSAAPGVAAAPADDLTSWWTSFGDAELTSLIERAAAQNLDAKAAALRIAEARNERDQAAAALWPSLTVNAAAQNNRLSATTATGQLFTQVPGFPNPYGQYQLGFDATWELDLWGRVRRQVEAAQANTAAQIEDSREVLISVLGDVGRAYIDLRGAQASRVAALETIATSRGLMDLAEQRRQAGQASAVDPVRAGADLASAQAQLPALDRQISADINQLSRLIGREPGALRGELEAAAPIPPPPASVGAGLPSDLARRRPDIRAAEARLHVATAEVGVAVADLYPRLLLAPQGGLQSRGLTDLTNWASRFVTVGPTVDLPIFDAGQRRATVRLQGVRAQEAALDYRRTVLAALHEVDNALDAYGADQARAAALRQAVAQDRDAATLARQRYDAGVASFLDVLTADRSLQANQLALAGASAAVSTDLVALYKALGGGWPAPTA